MIDKEMSESSPALRNMFPDLTEARSVFPTPIIPLLASTHFCMDVLLQGSALDLRSLNEVLLFDPCAVLRIFAAAAEEAPDAGSAQNFGECIVGLGRDGLARALKISPFTWEQQARLNKFAEHSVEVARLAQTAAASLGLCEETAYLIGLLHAIADLPHVLLWPTSMLPLMEGKTLLAQIVDHHRVPTALRSALFSLSGDPAPSLWTAVIQAAHDFADSGRSGEKSNRSTAPH